MKPLKATLEIPYDGDYVSVDIDWRVIEQVERIYGDLADTVAGKTLVNNPLRHKIAEVISSWLSSKGYKKRDVYQEVILADKDTVRAYVGCIQGAVLYMLRYINDEQLVILMKGEDLPDDEDHDDKKKPEKP